MSRKEEILKSIMDRRRAKMMSDGGMVAEMADPAAENIATMNRKAEEPSDEELLAKALGGESVEPEDDDDVDELMSGGGVVPAQKEPEISTNSGLSEEQKAAILKKKKNRVFQQ